jgi:hypothetical protein
MELNGELAGKKEKGLLDLVDVADGESGLDLFTARGP